MTPADDTLSGARSATVPPPSPRAVMALSTAAFALLGLGIARLTLRLNAHLAGDLSDTLLLHFWFLAGYGLIGALVGIVAAAAVTLARRFLPPWPWLDAVVLALAGALVLAPALYLALLPDMGLGSGLLTSLLTSRGGERMARLAALGLGLVLAGWMAAAALTLVARRWRRRRRGLLAACWILAALGLVATVRPERSEKAPPAEPASAEALPEVPAEPPHRVVLLCIDGVDLDDMILPMVEAGELPTFARLLREGTWGFLETYKPTLSAAIWTSLITGKPPEEHGIRHFLHFRLPGVGQAIYQFPLHTGLNFRFFPLLEEIPGLPVLRAPFTSNMRRVEALWNIVGRRHRVGAYRWLLAWPAEEVNGFSIAGAIGWVRFTDEARAEVGKGMKGGAAYPPQLGRMLAQRPHRDVPQEFIDAYVGEGHRIERDDPLLRPILASYNDPTTTELPALIEQFDVRFAASSFYPVDVFHHLFNAHRRQGGVFSDAIAERYRFTDARLGRLLDDLGDDTQLIVVSDHGYDFEHNHHTFAPPGIFLARGPAFEAGRRVDTLSVYDIAPLVLHLLAMPLPEDMRGTRSGRYRDALRQEFLDRHPVERIATYETLDAADHKAVESPKDEEIRDVLKTLGYIE